MTEIASPAGQTPAESAPAAPNPVASPAPVATPYGTPTSAEAARLEISQRSKDPATAKMLEGQDFTFKRHWDALFEIAHGGAGEIGADAPTEIDSLHPPGRASEFDVTSAWEGGVFNENDPASLQMDGVIRGALEAGRFTTGDGNYLVQSATRAAQETRGMSEEQYATWASQQYAVQLSVLGQGSEQLLNERLDRAGGFLAELEKTSPGIRQFLLNSGALDSASTVVALIQHVERLHERSAELDARRSRR